MTGGVRRAAGRCAAAFALLWAAWGCGVPSGVRLGPVERIDTHARSGAEVVLAAQNASDRPFVLCAGEFTLRYDGAEVLRAQLRDTVRLAPGHAGRTVVPLRLRIADELALHAVERKIRRGETDRMRVDWSVTFDAAGRMKKIGRRGLPLSKFLNTFGLTTDEVINDGRR